MPDVKISGMTPANRMLVNDLIEKSTGGTVTNNISSQGIFGADQADLPPAVPATEDDEFDAGSLDAKWTWENQGGAALTFGGSMARFQIPSAGGMDIRSLLQAVPVGNWTITTKLTTNNVPSSISAGGSGTTWASAHFFGLVLRESGTSKLIIQAVAFDTFFRSYIQTLSDNNTFVGTPAFYDALKSQQWYWLRITYDGTNYKWFLSYDGIFFEQYYSAAKAAFFTTGANQFGLFANSVGGLKFAATVDYFRKL